ncbi:MAG TPA: hypothetical protein VFS25_02445 [Chitinophaga sp.]|uniref:hypothetical protein n=1 Tax=Chitinophaga sp. TaxID=1869181 RepID=UPI002DB61F63|nr:hypothetical protein [Chitinophaga sp.]HEU4551657.1 hypothetical protein [Chitinophaga sp.]
MLLQPLGIDSIKLGEDIINLPDHEPFNAADKKMFVPGPAAEYWHRFSGDASCIENGFGDSFSARYIYFSTKDDKKINSIKVFPHDHTGYSLVDYLDKIFGIGSVAHGNMLEGVNPYHYMWNWEKKVDVHYLVPNDLDSGLECITFRFFLDFDTLNKYRLLYRTWTK